MIRPLSLLRLSLASLVVLASSAAAAQTVYRWVDDEGETHYTDDKSSIPKDKQKSAAKTEGGELGIAPARYDKADPAPEPAKVAESDENERAQLAADAKSEKEWRTKFRELRSRLGRLEKLVDGDKKVLEDNATVARLPEQTQVVKHRLAKEERDLAKAREELDDLEREAAGKSVPLEWRH